jgi:cytochrome o ubiquinol oxidase subunit 2
MILEYVEVATALRGKKNFRSLGAVAARLPRPAVNESFLLLFFKKEALAFLLRLWPTAFLLLLPGCGAEFRLFHPVGPVASAEWRFTLISTSIMMLIIVPTTVMTCVFAFRYRKSRNATYDPTFSHSLLLELAMWGVPLMITLVLAYCTYTSVFLVDPANPGSLLPAGTAEVKPGPLDANYMCPPGAVSEPGALEVDVITTDWQWIFVYPQQGIATIDDLVVPQGRNVQLQMTSDSVTNDFYIPQVAPMMDVMPGMRTMDGFRVDQPGSYEGFAADFSGDGFSWMQFSTRIVSQGDFAAWVKQTQASPNHLDYARFQQIAQPTINEGAKPSYFSGVPSNLFVQVYNATRNGVDYPVPEDIQTKAPFPSPTTGKHGEVKASS